MNADTAREAPSPRAMVLRPAAYFASAPLAAGAGARVALALVVGVGAAVARVGLEVPARLARSPALDVWPLTWVAVLACGLVVTPLRWFVGGWWVRVRLRWCGVPDAPAAEVRLASALTDLVTAVPAIVHALGATVTYDTPLRAARAAESPLREGAAELFLAAWSVSMVHQLAVARYHAQPRRARVWFAIVPGVFYALVFAAGLVTALLR